MTHTDRCESAKGDLCRCECQGELHGIKKEEKKPKGKEVQRWIDFIVPECRHCPGWDPKEFASGCEDMYNNIELRCERKYPSLEEWLK